MTYKALNASIFSVKPELLLFLLLSSVSAQQRLGMEIPSAEKLDQKPLQSEWNVVPLTSRGQPGHDLQIPESLDML